MLNVETRHLPDEIRWPPSTNWSEPLYNIVIMLHHLKKTRRIVVMKDPGSDELVLDKRVELREVNQ
jgi:hypothetical protein